MSKIKRECPKIICTSNNNNQIFLGTYKNIYSYDLTTFEQKKKFIIQSTQRRNRKIFFYYKSTKK